LAHPKERARLGSLFNAFFFTGEWWSRYISVLSCQLAGSSLAAIITIATFRKNSEWAWRIPSLLQFMPAVVSLIFINFIREQTCDGSALAPG
jgi:hypothetical protein